MKKVMTWVVRIVVLILLVKLVMWSWDQYQHGGEPQHVDNVNEMDKVCRITNPDYGSCVCLHRRTNEKLDIPYKECMTRARNAE